jgi:hypothetical protein
MPTTNVSKIPGIRKVLNGVPDSRLGERLNTSPLGSLIMNNPDIREVRAIKELSKKRIVFIFSFLTR